LLVCSF